MSAYKYMTGEGGIRFLGNWSLRITPLADFNDPFELRPPAGRVFTDEYVDTIFQDNAPRMMIPDLAEQMTRSLGQILTPQEITDFVTCIITPSDAKMQVSMLKNIQRKIPGFSGVKFFQLQEQVKSQLPILMQQAREIAKSHLP